MMGLDAETGDLLWTHAQDNTAPEKKNRELVILTVIVQFLITVIVIMQLAMVMVVLNYNYRKMDPR
jgi:hypothetical protein